MHIPLTPPDTTTVLAGLAPEQMVRLLGQGGAPSPLVHGTYLHWDEQRHRAPPDGLTHEQWWVRVKLARQVLVAGADARIQPAAGRHVG